MTSVFNEDWRSALFLLQTRCLASRISHRSISIQVPRAIQTTRQSQYLVPPSPESLGKASPAKEYRLLQRWGRRVFYIGVVGGGCYLIDRQFYASSISRSLRSFWLGIVVAADYKMNFRPQPWLGGDIADLHRRNAERLFNHLHSSGGLYLKIGQAIAMQSAILPPEFQKMFAKMFDDAPQNEWKDVAKVIREDFGGRSPEEVFGISFTGEAGKGVMEKRARASASVAQVHWARLPDGREVAIKIQKREIAHQVDWDLWSFKILMRLYTWYFDLPLYSLVPFVTSRLRLETDFVNEAKNSEKMAELIAGEPRLRGRVYIPKVYHDLSSSRVLTAEWIEGVRLWDKETLTKPWLGGRGKGSPGAGGSPLLESDLTKSSPPSSITSTLQSKPDRTSWKGRSHTGGLGLSLPAIMSTMVDLFSAQMFLFGLVHCDPHPGNVFIRRLPSGSAELVLIDHGLYISMTPSFRHQYCAFWKAMLSFDMQTIAAVTALWGVRAPDLFASATLMRPYAGGDGSTQRRIVGELQGKTPAERHYEVQERMRQGIREILSDQDAFPQELIFIGRNLRIVQGNNQFLGSPVNRIKTMGLWASRGLVESRELGLHQRTVNWARHLLFRFTLLATDAAWWWGRLRQWVGRGGGMEDEIEKQMAFLAKDQLGVELQHGVFDG